MTVADDVARAIGRIAGLAQIGARTLGPLDTNPVPAGWSHVTKIDPEVEKKLPLLFPLYLQHTSAVSVGGSRDVTGWNTEETLSLLARIDRPVFHEPSDPEHVTDRTRDDAEFIAIPEVLNGDAESLVGKLGAGGEHLREELIPGLIDETAPWLPRRVRDRVADFATSWELRKAVFEAYIIQNLDSAAAREANVTEADLLTPERAAHRAIAAEKRLGSEVIYLEYSGRFGGDEATDILAAVDDAVSWSRIWYGGGLDDRENVRAVLDAGADAVVVGNVFHEIAEEEAAVFEDATAELDANAAPSRVRGWVDGTVDVGESAAVRYLDTVPGVGKPAETARRYLTAAVRARLALERLAAEADGDVRTVDDLGRFVEERRATLAGVGAEDLDGLQSLLEAYALCHVGGRVGIDVDAIPSSHVSLGRG